MKPRNVTITLRTYRGEHYYIVTAKYPGGRMFSQETALSKIREQAYNEACMIQSEMKNTDWEVTEELAG